MKPERELIGCTCLCLYKIPFSFLHILKPKLMVCLMMLMTVRTALVALIAFMPTPPNGALGSLDYKKEERRELAIRSREGSPKFGTPDRQKVIDEVSLK